MNKIVQRAELEGVPLSEVERKMLYFSVTSPTLPDSFEVNEIFDRDYDQIEYEKKIVNLIRHIRKVERRDKAANGAWNKAVRALSEGDFYLLVMVDEAGEGQRPPGDLLKLIATAVIILAVGLAVAYFFVGR